MAVLGTIAAMAWPHLQPGLSRAAYRSAAMQLKSEFSEAREQTIHDGQVREFRLKPGTGRYVITVATRSGAEGESKPKPSSRDRRSGIPDRNGAMKANERSPIDSEPEFRELPGDLIFRHAADRDERSPRMQRHQTSPGERERMQPQGTSKEEHLEDVLSSDSGEWILGIRFFPDGRATEGVVELEGLDAEHMIAVHVRGLTGGVKIGPVESLVTELDRTVERPTSFNPTPNTK